jgi:RNA polymerase sigma-70 factor (ECF subfamily)
LRSSGSGNDARAEELADSLYAELYGVRSAGGERRKSLFDYFHGRSKLSTWLRAVLAQRHVDLLRTDHGTISLDSGSHSRYDGRPDGRGDGVAVQLQAATDTAPADPDRAKYLARLDRALLAAFACLTPRERMLLSCYYLDHLTLGEIGRALGEHESTMSRQLERTRRALRETVTDLLRRGAPAQDGNGGDAGLDVSQIELTFEYALEDWPFDLSQTLSKAGRAAEPPDQ